MKNTNYSICAIVGLSFVAAPLSVLANAKVPVLSLPAESAVEQSQPNIVHILVDDLGWQDIACYYDALHGEKGLYETPNIDRVAARGIRFMQAYSPSPTCSPSRAAYLSGQFGVKMGSTMLRAVACPAPGARALS